MAYNSYFPQSYQPMYYSQPSQPFQNAPQGGSSITWVQGIAGAKSYLVAPNSTAQLWDSETQRIYLKSADSSGLPSMKILEYKIVENPVQETDMVNPMPMGDYVTKAEFSEFEKKVNALMKKLEKEEEDEQPFV